MLVRLKEPMGYSTIDNYRIYGKYYAYGSFGPTQVPRKIFFAHKNILEEVEITDKWLNEKTSKVFPRLKFFTTKMADLNLEDTIVLAKLLGIQFIKTKNINKTALSRAIVKRIEAL